MNKNRKIVAFICAMAMILSVFTGFTVVNAEEPTRGFVFDNIQQSKDGKTITMDIKYQGYELGLSSFTIYADVPSAVTAIKTTSKFAGAVDDYSNGVYALTYAGSSNATTENSVVANLELTLAAELTEDVQIELKDETAASAMNADESDYEYDDTVSGGGIAKANVTLKAATTPVETPTPTSKPVSKPVVLPDMDITTGDVPETTDDLYVAVVIKTKDGNDAEYGKDYVAELTLPNGDVKELTEDDLNNILNGYFDLVEGAEDMTWDDVISGLTFNALSDGLSFNAQLINGSEVISGGDVEVTFEPEKPEKAPAITLETKVANKKATKVSVGKVMTLTAKTDKVVEDAVYEYVISDSDKAYLEPITATVTDDVLTVKFEGKKTKSNIKITVNYLDADDVVLATKSVTVSVVKEETATGGNGSSSSDSSSGNSNGSIAHGGVVSNNNSKVAFVDIDTVPWAEDSILALVDKGVINGRSDSIFDPNGTVTRAEFAKMVVLAFGLTGGSGVDEFSDVENTDWFASYVARGYYNGVISGYDDGTFRPNGLISRQEMAAMIARAVKAANKTLPETVAAVTFEDADQIADWAMDAVTTLQKGGVINGMTETTYAPLENATRAQAAVIIYRAMTNAK